MSPRTDLLQTLAGKSELTAEDALTARPVLFDDMSVSTDEAEALFRINDGATEISPEWRMLFVEALTDYLVRQEQPSGYVDEAKADWLMARIVQDGQVKGDTELELLIYTLEQAYQAPPALTTFALKQAAAFGEKALTADKVSRISRVVYAFAGDGGGAAVSRNDAEVLFDLNDAARGEANDPSWEALFVHAVGAALMTAAGYMAPSREEALRRDAWLNGDGSVLWQTLLAMRTDPLLSLRAWLAPDPAKTHNRAVEAAQAEAESVNAEEAAWLVSRIGRDGVLDANEIALLQFIRAEASSVDVALQPLLETAAPAAGDRG